MRRPKTFRIGGLHTEENKQSRAEAIVAFPPPHSVTIPLSQHIGAPAVAAVAKGERVKVGQLIGRSGGFVSAAVHSSVSGTVTAVDALPDTLGVRRPLVMIAVEGDEWLETIDRSGKVIRDCALNPKEIVEKIAAAGIVGMGGATFPTHVKLTPPEGKAAEYLLINGVECEPYLTTDHRLMLERGEELLTGASILAKALGARRSYIGIEVNKMDAIVHLERLAASFDAIEVVPLKVRYPQGGEKQLIDAVLRRQVPPGGLPIDVGAVVQNIGTAYAVYEAVQKNKPLIERVITVTGKPVKRPANLLVRIGTPVRALLEHCGVGEKVEKIIGGGPMMGRSIANIEAPVTKGSSGILVMSAREARRRPATDSCIRCAKCTGVCCMALEPYLLAKMSKLGLRAETEALRVTDCIECGSCLYICPAGLPLLDYIRLAKAEVMKTIQKRRQK